MIFWSYTGISEKLSVRTIEEANDLIKEKQETKKHNVVTSSQSDVVTPKVSLFIPSSVLKLFYLCFLN